MSRIIENYINEIFDERQVDIATRKKLWKFYNSKLSGGVDKAIKDEKNLKIETDELAALLKSDLAKFSAFKEEHFNQALLELLGKNGSFPTRKEFMSEARKVDQLYNKHWLDTEYDLTVAKAQNALQWKDYEGRVHLYPNVRYIAIHDGRTRPLHLSYDGLVLPYIHSFWTKHLPPWEYGCRCGTEQTDDDVNIPEGIDLDIATKPGIGGNAAQTGQVWEDNHPYYQMGGGSINDVEKRLEQFTKKSDHEVLAENSRWTTALADVKKVNLDKQFSKMSWEEMATAHDYTGTGYHTVNQYLFTGRSTEFIEAYERILNDALDKMPICKEDIVVRGMKFNDVIFKKYKDNLGKEIIHGGFTSTSTQENVATMFSGSGKSLKFYIEHKNGKTVGEISAYSETFGGKSEFEVLFKSKTKFLVKLIEEVGDSYEIYLEEI